MNAKKLAVNSAKILSLTVAAGGVFGYQQAAKAMDPVTHAVCDNKARLAVHYGTDYTPTLACKIANKL